MVFISVKGYDGSGRLAAQSEEIIVEYQKKVTVDEKYWRPGYPELIYADESGVFTLDWEAQPDAQSYTIEIANTTGQSLHQKELTDRFFKSAPLWDGKYWVTVKAKGNSGSSAKILLKRPVLVGALSVVRSPAKSKVTIENE